MKIHEHCGDFGALVDGLGAPAGENDGYSGMGYRE